MEGVDGRMAATLRSNANRLRAALVPPPPNSNRDYDAPELFV
jgi:hypothetical protein